MRIKPFLRLFQSPAKNPVDIFHGLGGQFLVPLELVIRPLDHGCGQLRKLHVTDIWDNVQMHMVCTEAKQLLSLEEKLGEQLYLIMSKQDAL